MKAMYKVLLPMGGVFTLVGAANFIVFVINIERFGWIILIPMIFLVLGISLLIYSLNYIIKLRTTKRLGTKRAAKIYDYVEDTSATINGKFPVNTVVHYFDEDGKECERILETGFSRGSDAYPLGMTVNIYEYKGRIAWDKDSVRNEEIPGEEKLMDNVPVHASGKSVVAVECSSCGASFSAVKGFATKCPYCGKNINA